MIFTDKNREIEYSGEYIIFFQRFPIRSKKPIIHSYSQSWDLGRAKLGYIKIKATTTEINSWKNSEIVILTKYRQIWTAWEEVVAQNNAATRR